MSRRELYPLWTWIAWVILVPMAVTVGAITLALTTDAELPFDNPQLWWLVGAVPLGGLLFLYGFLLRRRAMERFAPGKLGAMLTDTFSPGKQALRAGFFVTALFLLVAAIVGPRWAIHLEKQKVYGVDIVAALDVSRSMLVRDVPPSRIGRAKEIMRQQLTERAVFNRASRLALLAFAGATSVRLPLTTDHLAFRDKLKAVGVGSVARGGTAIGRAIAEGADLFAKSPAEATKVLLVFTDGEDHEGLAADEAKRAYEEQGVRVFTIGIGDPSLSAGGRVPADADNQGKPFLYNGQIIFSKLDVDGLRKIAAAGGGGYAPLEELNRLIDRIASMRQTELGTEQRMRHNPRYQWFLTAALLLLGLEMLISERRAAGESQPQRVWQQEAA